MLLTAGCRPRVLRLNAGLFSFVCALFLLTPAKANKLYVQGTEHIEVFYYSPAHEYLVQHVVRSYENALRFEQSLFHYTPSQKVSVLLEDFGDYGHGAASAVPYNFISLGIEPLSYTYETLPANERTSWIMNHESIHIVIGDNGNTVDRRFRKLFLGKVAPNADDPVSMFYSSLASPRFYSTRWFHEGIAAFFETWMAGGLGRAMGGYDEMVFRSMVRDDAYMYSVVGLESEGTAIDFQTGANSYLYGTRFLTWLSLTYGPDKLLEWISRQDHTRRYFGSRFAQVYGMSLEDGWNRWLASERKWQNANLAAIRKYPVTDPKRIASTALGGVSRPYFNPKTNQMYVAVRHPGDVAHIAAIDVTTGELTKLRNIKGPGLYYVTSLAYDPDGNKLYYTTDNNAWRDLNVYDIATHTSTVLLRDVRIGDLVWNRSGHTLWGVQHNNGLSSLVVIQPEQRKSASVKIFEYGNDIFDIDVSPDGEFLTAAISDLSGRQKLVRYGVAELQAGKGNPEVLHDFEFNSPGNFVYSPDGHYLYGSSYYTGVSNLFRYDFAAKKMDVISNAETGLFRPLPLPDHSLMAFEYTGKGFIPARVPDKPLEDVSAVKYLGMDLLEKHQSLLSWKLPSPSTIPAERLITRAGKYDPIRNVRLIAGYPILQGYKDTAAAGMRFELSDALRVASANITASISPAGVPANERLHVSLDSHYWNWRLIGYYNNADFYDLFGPTKVSRKGYSLKLAHTKYLLYDSPRTLQVDWSIAGYGGLDRLPEYQNVVATYRNLLEANGAIRFMHLDRTQGAIDDERGNQWGVYSRFNYAGSKASPRIWATYDHGTLAPLRNSAFWVHASAGKSFGDNTNPFAQFYFGGFGNNYVDRDTISRYREFYSFPGVRLNEIPATSFGKITGEWNLPPLRFRRVGTTALYLNWARLSLFSTGLFTNFANAPARKQYADFGSQLDFRIVLFTYLNTTLSAGYAGAADNTGRVTTEYMISLKIL